jgi:penicillin-binding protein 1A
MAYALKGVPITEPRPPEGVLNVAGEWIYDEYAQGAGVTSLGVEAAPPPTPPTEDEKKSILDLFKN